MEKRLNLALFMGMIENNFSYAICEGVMMGAKAIDANLFILPGGLIGAQYDDVEANSYRYQYNTLYSFANFKSLDAILIEYGTITTFLGMKQQRNFLSQFKDVPIILLCGEQEGYSNIVVDNRAGMRSAIEHLFTHHNCKHVGFVSGPVSNLDALERLNVFRDVVKNHGIELDEDYIIYGNFSEYCKEDVEEFLLSHPEVEAIACANDDMANGVYKAARAVGREPGKDILVTGFDDSSTAMLVEPHLTTVRADPKELAYHAVLQCPLLIAGEDIHKTVESKLITRGSCGCSGNQSSGNEIDFGRELLTDDDIRAFADEIFHNRFNVYFGSKNTEDIEKLVEQYFLYIFRIVKEDGTLDFKRNEFAKQYMSFSKCYTEDSIELYDFFSINNMIQSYLMNRLNNDSDKIKLISMFSDMKQELMLSVTRQKVYVNEENKLFEVLLSTTTRDIFQFAKDEKRRCQSIVGKFQHLNFDSSYLFTYSKGITHSEGSQWKYPDNIYVSAYHNKDQIVLYKGKEKKINIEDVFSADFLPQNRRYDMFVMPLFSGEVQYGLLMTESSIEHFRYASQMACQVSVSLEVIEILEQQNALKRELEENLAQTVAHNKELDEMSRIDPLTQIANRRGFTTQVIQMLKNPIHAGKHAIAVYADMDKLKVVNDEFGHEDGDFALSSIAKILTESFRKSDVVGRMGGDEFAAFAIVNQDNYAEVIKKRIRDISKRFNDNCDKPYYVNMSVGVYEFTISDDVNLEHVLNLADENLYQEKKNKVKVIYKDKKE